MQTLLQQRCALSKYPLLKSQDAHDQIAHYASHSFLVEVEIYAGYIYSVHVCIIVTWKLGLRAPLLARD